jgi:dTDP-4-amino-4,6-dideoxygalactose transaminase
MVGAGESDAVVFSFYATKTITTGEGGMVVTRKPAVAERVRTMRLHGINRNVFDRYRSTKPSWLYEVVAPGYKYNLPDPAAAMGRVQLMRAHSMRDRRASIAAQYDIAFADLPLHLPARATGDDVHSWHLYVVRSDDAAPIDRDGAIEQLAGLGVGTSVHFIPLHRHPYWRESYDLRDVDFPVATRSFTRALSLPLFSSMTSAQVDRVISAVRRVFG